MAPARTVRAEARGKHDGVINADGSFLHNLLWLYGMESKWQKCRALERAAWECVIVVFNTDIDLNLSLHCALCTEHRARAIAYSERWSVSILEARDIRIIPRMCR